jgi:hypothetical protein
MEFVALITEKLQMGSFFHELKAARRQSRGLGTVDAAEWRHAVATTKEMANKMSGRYSGKRSACPTDRSGHDGAPKKDSGQAVALQIIRILRVGGFG